MKKDEIGGTGWKGGWRETPEGLDRGEPREGVAGTEITRSGRRGPQAPQRLVIQNPTFLLLIRLFDQPASLRPIIRPLSKSVSCSYCRRLRLRGILSLNIVYQSHQIRLDSRTALVLMLLNSPSCATNMRIAHLALSHWLRNFNHLHISYQTTFLPSFVIVA
ncbi:hypothetical protein TNCV_1585021 [Trichonephila clavipes]|nr:hypothetical protein TNCV_1585021 [Trichonephila clavipes]